MALSAKLASLFIDVLVRSDKVKSGLAEVRGQAASTGRAISNAFAVSAATYGFIRAMKDLATVTAEVERGFSRIRAVTGQSAGEFRKFESMIRGIASESRIATFEEFQEALRTAAQLGIRGSEGLAAFADTAARLSLLSGTGIERVSDSLGKIQEVFGFSLSEVDRFGSALADLAVKSVATEAEILNVTERISGMAGQLGLTADQAAAFAAAMKDAGVRSEIAGSSLLRLFTVLATKPLEVVDALGLSADQTDKFLKTLALDPSKSVLMFFERLNELGLGSVGVLKKLQIAEARTLGAFQSMSRITEKISEHLATGNKAWEENIALMQKSNMVADDLQGSFTRLWNSAVNLYSTLGKHDIAFGVNFRNWSEEAAGQMNAFSKDLARNRGLPAAIQLYISNYLSRLLYFDQARSLKIPQSNAPPQPAPPIPRKPFTVGAPPDQASLMNTEKFRRQRFLDAQIQEKEKATLDSFNKGLYNFFQFAGNIATLVSGRDPFSLMDTVKNKNRSMPQPQIMGLVDAWKQAQIEANKTTQNPMIQEQKKANKNLERIVKINELISRTIHFLGTVGP